MLYDGDCPMCVRLVGLCVAILQRHGFDIALLQSPWVRFRVGLSEDEPPTEMLVLTSTDEVVGGAEGVVFLAQRIWWAWPLYAIARLPGVMWLLGHLYRWVARNRGGDCNVKRCTSTFVNGTKDKVQRFAI